MDVQITVTFSGKLSTANVDQAIARAGQKVQRPLVSLVQSKTPKRSGHLASQWLSQLSGNGLSVTNLTKYAPFVEYGTKRFKGREMLTKSVPEMVDRYQQAIADELKAELGG